MLHLASSNLQDEASDDSKHSRNTETFESLFTSNHIPLSMFQRALLSIGSASISLSDPSRGGN